MLFRLAVAAIAIHVVDDTFVQPNAGTSAGDHVVAGLVPLALLALAAWAYPRLRGSRQAALALVLAPFGVVGGIEAIHYAREGVFGGDDYTGVLSLAGGVALLGLGAATAWRRRSTDGGTRRVLGRRALAGISGAVVAQFVLFPLVLGYAFTHVARAPVSEIRLGPTAVGAELHTSDDLDLQATYVPSRNGAAVIVFPGRKTSQKHARMLMRHGYGVLIMDRRGEGLSDGDPNSFGWHGERDISAGVDYLRQRPDVRGGRIGGLGLSVGGELMLEHAAERDGLKAVVSEGAGTRQAAEDADMPGADHNPLARTMQSLVTASTAVFSSSSPPPRLRHIVHRIAPTPLFLIYAKDGQKGTERNNNPELFKAARTPKRMWEVPTGGHMGGIDNEPRDYELKVTGFFDRALLG
jgi:uncharacterized protein